MMKYCTYAAPRTIKSYLDEGVNISGSHVSITGRLTRIKPQAERIFGELDDGSGINGMQFIYNVTDKDNIPEGIETLMRATTGSSVRLSGTIVVAPEKAKQDIELKLEDATIISAVTDTDNYKYGIKTLKRRSPEKWVDYLVQHVRQDQYQKFRDRHCRSLMRIRGISSTELTAFFARLGFLKIDTPILTASDCEGAGEMFTVTGFNLKDLPFKDGDVDFSKDFFGRHANLTVSGQLEAEALCQCLGNVFTFGPTFRAENSMTTRHLAEFWMLEPELVFQEVDEEERFSRLLDLMESMVKCVTDSLMAYCKHDLEFLDSTCSKGVLDKLKDMCSSPFQRVTYTESIDILSKAVEDGHDFEEKNIVWGMDLASEHEKYLCEQIYNKPTFVTNYPQELKSFYMKADKNCPPGRATCQATDLLVPGIGELCGGSMREDDPDKMIAVMEKKGVPTDDLQWYIDLRKEGGLPTGGFGLGFERFVRYVTGAPGIQDITAFPRYPGKI